MDFDDFRLQNFVKRRPMPSEGSYAGMIRKTSTRLIAVVALGTLVACSSSTAAPGSASTAADGGASGGRLYVAMMNNAEIVVLDETSRSIVEHIPVGKYPTALVRTPDYSKLYTTNFGDNTVSAIDLATRKVLSISIDSAPAVAVTSADGHYIYVALGSKHIAAISTASDTITSTLSVDDAPAAIAISPDGATLYVAAVSFSSGPAGPLADKIEAISAATGAVVHSPIGVGNGPGWMSISPDGSIVYTFNALSGDVTVVDTVAWSVTATVSLGSNSFPGLGAASPDGRLVVVTDFGTADVTAIDAKTNKVAWKTSSDGRPGAVGFSADGTRGYFADSGHESLSVSPSTFFSGLFTNPPTPPASNGMEKITEFDPTTGETVGAPISLPGGPGSIIVSPH